MSVSILVGVFVLGAVATAGGSFVRVYRYNGDANPLRLIAQSVVIGCGCGLLWPLLLVLYLGYRVKRGVRSLDSAEVSPS